MAAPKMKSVVQLRAEADCPSHSRADVAIRDLSFSIDEPVERGGTNSGPTPTDTALAALIGCTNVIGHKCAKKLGIDIGHLTIRASCDFDRRGVTLSEEIDVPFQRVDLDVEVDGNTSDDELAALAAEVQKFCPLSKLFRAAGTEIVEHWHRR
jgi:uncharacterized OsmC-like protein